MKIRLYIDEDSMQHALVQALKARGVDVVTALDEQMIAHSDDAHLKHATKLDRSLYSFNVKDYVQLHTEYMQEGNHHAGIILAKQQHYAISEQVRRLLHLLAEKSSEQMQDSVEFLSVW